MGDANLGDFVFLWIQDAEYRTRRHQRDFVLARSSPKYYADINLVIHPIHSSNAQLFNKSFQRRATIHQLIRSLIPA